MILIIGGRGAGKRTYAKEMGYAKGDMADGVLDARPVVYHVQDMVFADPAASMGLLPMLCAKEVVICDEVGSGVIPLERANREAREATGRLCAALAAEATRVIRMVCGIPQIIKEAQGK